MSKWQIYSCFLSYKTDWGCLSKRLFPKRKIILTVEQWKIPNWILMEENMTWQSSKKERMSSKLTFYCQFHFISTNEFYSLLLSECEAINTKKRLTKSIILFRRNPWWTTLSSHIRYTLENTFPTNLLFRFECQLCDKSNLIEKQWFLNHSSNK